MRGKLFTFIAAGAVVLAGCGPPAVKPLRICPGRENVFNALSALRLRSQHTVPLKANGQCRLQLYLEGERKPHKENLTVKFWLNPPAEIYLQGDASLIPKAIVFGSNEDEFWLGIRPKEVSTYWWGVWDEQDSLSRLPLRPKLLLEALGAVELGGEQNWSLSNEGAFDVLTKRGETGSVAKKVYIYNCDGHVHRIEYFDDEGEVMFAAELAKYKDVSEGFSVPTVVEIVRCGEKGREDSARITISSLKTVNFTDKASDRIFTRPEPRGFRHVIRIVDGKPVEQAQ